MQLITHTNIQQGSEEWHNVRLGKITGSGFYRLLGTKEAQEKYLYDRANEIVTGCKSDGEEYQAGVCRMHMERGNNYESLVREMYKTYNTFADVNEVGLIQLGDYLACSPDGLVDDEGMIEIKVLDSNNYFRQVLRIDDIGVKALSKEHFAQIQFCLYICNRQWCDYVLYNPKHSDAVNKGLSIFRVEVDSEMQERISKVVTKSIAAIKWYITAYYAITNEHKIR